MDVVRMSEYHTPFVREPKVHTYTCTCTYIYLYVHVYRNVAEIATYEEHVFFTITAPLDLSNLPPSVQFMMAMFREFCALLWLLHVRDNASRYLRQVFHWLPSNKVLVVYMIIL